MPWKHETPNTLDDILVTRQATLQPEWAIAERLEEIARVLNQLCVLLDERLTPPA